MRFLSVALILILAVTPLVAYKADKSVSDDSLYDQVRLKLANDAEVGGVAIAVEVHNGAVTLKGKVKTERQKSRAEKVAKKVKGVTSVENQLIISPD